MKKNILLILSMMLILGMFLSMAYVKLFGKSENAMEDEIQGNVPQHLKLNIRREPLTLHPGLAVGSSSESVVQQLFEGLTRKELWGQTVNAAASIIKISDDLKTYTFTIREANWSNGDPVIAKDFEYAWKWILNPENKSSNAYQLYYIEGAQAFNEGKGNINDVGVRALDDKTLEVKLASPTPNFYNILALPTYFPINSKVAEKNPDWANEAGNQYTTNGAFQLTEWSHKNKIVLEKNKNYWDANMVNLEKISMLMVSDSEKELTLYEKGDLTILSSPSDKMIIEDEMFYTQSIPGSYSFKINTNAEPFTNKNIRKALALSINRQEIVDNIMKKKIMPAMAAVHPTFFPENKKGYFNDNDVKLAKQYLQKGLEELGYKGVSQLPTITLSFTTNTLDKKIAESIQNMWTQNLGVRVTLDGSDGNIQNEKIQTLNYEIALLETLSNYNEPLNVLEPFRDANNDTGWQNEEFQNLLRQSYIETDNNGRLALLKKAEAQLVEEMPVIPIYFFTIEVIQSKQVNNVAFPYPGQLQLKWAELE